MAGGNTTTSDQTEESKNKSLKVREQNITRPIELYLLFWVDEDYDGRKLFAEAAQTRMKNIKKSATYNPVVEKVHCPPIQTMQEIGTITEYWINHYGGKDKAKVKEVGVFSHSGWDDGPITVYGVNDPPLNPEDTDHGFQQMAVNGWATMDFNWVDKGAKIVFYGCNSGRDEPSAFAIRLSAFDSFKNVQVWGQQDFSNPSDVPDKRSTYLLRDADLGWDLNNTYMVAAPLGTGMQAHIIFFKPDAIPMGVYINGKKICDLPQSMFNDHRKK